MRKTRKIPRRRSDSTQCRFVLTGGRTKLPVQPKETISFAVLDVLRWWLFATAHCWTFSSSAEMEEVFEAGTIKVTLSAYFMC